MSLFTRLIFLGAFSIVGYCLADDSPSMSVDVDGNTVIAWHGSTLSGSKVYARIKDSAGSWGSINILSTTETGSMPKVAAIKNGSDIQAVAIWTESDGMITWLYGAVLTSISNGWESAFAISTETENAWSQHEVSIVPGLESGEATAVATWTSDDRLGNISIRSSSALVAAGASSPWSTPVTVSQEE